MVCPVHQCCHRPSVFQPLAGPLGERGQHGVRGITDQRHSAPDPLGRWRTIKQRPLAKTLGGLDHAGDRWIPPGKVLQRLGDLWCCSADRTPRFQRFWVWDVLFHHPNKVRHLSPCEQIADRVPPGSGPNASGWRRRAPAQSRKWNRCAPRGHASVAGRLRAKSCAAQGRAQAVCGNDHVRAQPLAILADHARAILKQPLHHGPQPHAARCALVQRLAENINQVGPVNMHVGRAPAVVRGAFDRQAKNRKPAAPHPHFQRFGQKSALQNGVLQPQGAHDFHAVGRKLDPCPDLTQRHRAFDHLHVPTPVLERQGRRETGNAGPRRSARARVFVCSWPQGLSHGPRYPQGQHAAVAALNAIYWR